MIYLDHNATSPLLAEVRAAMEPWWGVPTNASSVHRAGQDARAALELARGQVAAFLGRPAAGVVFTSGATEANQAWWHGMWQRGVRGFATSAVEHPCVLGAAESVRRQGGTVHLWEVDADGRARMGDLPDDVGAVSLMAANHETGVLQPLAEALATGLPVHVDATQGAGRVELDLASAHGVVISGHKLGGPPGIGALSLPGGEAFPALLTGGTQERGRRAGTVNLPGAVGLGVACAVAQRELSTRRARWLPLRDALESGLEALGARVVGAAVLRVPQTTCAVLPVGPSELVVQALDLRGIAVSAGAACASGSQEPSPVLTAMGDAHPDRSLRISLGPDSTRADVDALLGALAEVLPALADLE